MSTQDADPLAGCEVKRLEAIEVCGPRTRERDVSAHLVTEGWMPQASGYYTGPDLTDWFVIVAVREITKG